MSGPVLLGAGDPHLAPSTDLDDSRRAVVAAELAGATEPGRSDQRQRVLNFVDAHPDALSRSCAPGHLTASGAVVDATGERALLVLHAKLGRWLQPGGHTEGDANLAAVALREASEETGIVGLAVRVPAIDLDIHTFRSAGEAEHLHFDLRHLVRAPSGAEVALNHESRSARWVGQGDLEDASLALDASTRRLLGRAFAVTAR